MKAAFFIVALTSGLLLTGLRFVRLSASARNPRVGLGVDVDFYTGSVSRNSWLRMKNGGVKVVVAQAWGGRSRNEFAVAQLSGARRIGSMKEGAYILLNFDDKVCRSYAHPVRDMQGRCQGGLVAQDEPGGRWQVRQGILALGEEAANVKFIAIDVECFTAQELSSDDEAATIRRKSIVDAINEVRKLRKRPIIYTRNAKGHWQGITACDGDASDPNCLVLRQMISSRTNPVPLWDVEKGSPTLTDFRPYGLWISRVGRQYELDRNMFGLAPRRTVDLNVFDLSLVAN